MGTQEVKGSAVIYHLLLSHLSIFLSSFFFLLSSFPPFFARFPHSHLHLNTFPCLRCCTPGACISHFLFFLAAIRCPLTLVALEVHAVPHITCAFSSVCAVISLVFVCLIQSAVPPEFLIFPHVWGMLLARSLHPVLCWWGGLGVDLRD